MQQTILKNVSKIAICQMNSKVNPSENFTFCQEMIAQASKNQAKLVCFPENFHFFFQHTNEFSEAAETIPGKTINQYCDLAKQHNIWVSLGGFPEKIENSKKVFNAHILISNEGEIKQVYRKTHLFDVSVDNKNTLRESDFTEKGPQINDPTTTPIGKIGLGICYDLRFPELFRKLEKQGSEIILNPAAFLKKTGEAHWHVLCRARAIENQCFFVAAAQVGFHHGTRISFGHSLVVNPWGEVLLDMKEEVGLGYADIDLNLMQDIRNRLPSVCHKRNDLY